MKKYKILVMLFLFGLLVSACGNSNKASAEDVEKYSKNAQKVISIVNSKDVFRLKDICSDDLKNALTDEIIEQINVDVGSKGDFDSFMDVNVSYQKDKNTGQDYILVIQKVKYNNGELIYTLTFNNDEKLLGIFYK
ncbi:DUF3887 domain-containing protein [Peptoniphilus sp. oral taxon 386]|uniref:DUF3887 domain-containing protein n=1 Tax=Peptoniphilus sp. oral taxon 386 TaxID=652713 RepID=UPI0001DA9AC9|nr:DUF3887 domain-containing protein [Peptoniphilus sp. oral taxon 386]EFI42019.1 hypothetical protein HMPREF0629_00652 [Peptoniphilus sp. oral taxon 386 str. F0131]